MLTSATSSTFFPILAQATRPAWETYADHLANVLATLDPQERRKVLERINRVPEPQKPKPYPIGECVGAARRITELLTKHPSWPQARARATVARELGISTVQLRRMLRHVQP